MKRIFSFILFTFLVLPLVASNWESALIDEDLPRFEALSRVEKLDWAKASVLATYLKQSSKPRATTVSYLISRGAKVTEMDESGIPAVIHASARGDGKLLTVLKNAGADLNIQINFPRRGETFNWLSGLNRHFSFFYRGKTLSNYDIGVLTPALYALINKNEKGLEFFISGKDAPKNDIPLASGATVSLFTIAAGMLWSGDTSIALNGSDTIYGLVNFRCASILYKNRKEVLSDSDFYKSPLGPFFSPGTKALEEILKTIDFESQEQWVWTAYAIASGDPGLLAVVLKARGMGINDLSMPESGESNKTTVLGFALARGWVDVVIELLKRGASAPITVKPPQVVETLYPLYLAADWDRPDLVDLLIKSGQNPQLPSKSPYTVHPLFAPGASFPVRQSLLDNGVSIDIKNLNKRTLFQEACRLGDRELANWCIKKGADIRINTRYGVSSLHLACASGNLDLVKDLISLGLSPGSRPSTHISSLDFSQESFYYREMNDGLSSQTPYTPREMVLKISKTNRIEFLKPKLMEIVSYLEKVEKEWQDKRSGNRRITLAIDKESESAVEPFPKTSNTIPFEVQKTSPEKTLSPDTGLGTSSDFWAWGGNFYGQLSTRAMLEPETQFTVFGAWAERVPGNLLAVGFKNEELFFIAGYLSASQSQTGKIALLVPDNDSWSRSYNDDAEEVFELGVKAFNPEFESFKYRVGSNITLENERDFLFRGADVVVPVNSLEVSKLVELSHKSGLTIFGLGTDWTKILKASMACSFGISREKALNFVQNQLAIGALKPGQSVLLGLTDDVFQFLGNSFDNKVFKDLWNSLLSKIKSGEVGLPNKPLKYLNEVVLFPL